MRLFTNIAESVAATNRTCRGCGCTDLRACPGGCAWVLLDIHSPTGICSSCGEEMEWDPRLLATIGFLE